MIGCWNWPKTQKPPKNFLVAPVADETGPVSAATSEIKSVSIEEKPAKVTEEASEDDDYVEVEEDDEDDGEHEHGSDCDHHEPHIHESDPNDPVTQLCATINADLEKWEDEGSLNKDKLNTALDRFEAALKLTTAHMDALLGKAYVLGELGDTEAATQTLLQALAVDSKDIRVHTMLSDMGDFVDDEVDLELVSKFMDQKGNPSDGFKAALVNIFNRFAVEDGSGQNALTKTSMNKFHDHVNGGPLSDDAVFFLFSGEWELNKKGSITLDGFINFYLNQTFSSPFETISDLRKLGYDEDCNPLPANAPTPQ